MQGIECAAVVFYRKRKDNAADPAARNFKQKLWPLKQVSAYKNYITI